MEAFREPAYDMPSSHLSAPSFGHFGKRWERVETPQRSRQLWTGCILILYLAAFSSTLLSQIPDSPQTSLDSTVRKGVRTSFARHVDRAPKLDGTLDVPLRQEAKLINNWQPNRQ